MLVSVRCASGTFRQNSTAIQFEFDVDQNAVTGHPFEGLGLEYILDMGSSYYGAEAHIGRYVGGEQYQTFGTAPVSYVPDGIDVAIPLALIGGDAGRVNFRVVTNTHLGGNTFSTILDYMPDRLRPPAVVQ